MKSIAVLLAIVLLAATACGEGTRVTSLCAPALLAPTAGATLDNGCRDRSNPVLWEFAWMPCPSATSYQIYVARRGATIPVIDEESLAPPSYTFSDLGFIVDANRTDWYWRVRARTRGSWGPWSAERAFDVEPLDTDCP